HVRGVAAGAGAAGEPARAAPARHHAGDGSWVDITIGGRVERHARLLASRWLRHPSDYQEPLTSRDRHAALRPRRYRYVPTSGSPVLKQALSLTLPGILIALAS